VRYRGRTVIPKVCLAVLGAIALVGART